MNTPESLFFYTLHKCASTLFGSSVLNNLVGLEHVDHARQIYSDEQSASIQFEEHGFVYGPLRVSANPESPVHRLLVGPACEPGFVRDKKAIFMIRDPRDVLISAYHSFGFTHNISANPAIAQLQVRDRAEILRSTLDDYVLQQAARTRTNYETIARLLDECQDGLLLRYEDMVADWDAFAQKLVGHVSMKPEALAALHHASRPREEIDPGAHKRSGRIDQFRTALHGSAIETVNTALTPILRTFGYAP